MGRNAILAKPEPLGLLTCPYQALFHVCGRQENTSPAFEPINKRCRGGRNYLYRCGRRRFNKCCLKSGRFDGTLQQVYF